MFGILEIMDAYIDPVSLLNYSIGILISPRPSSAYPQEKRSFLRLRNGAHKLTVPRLSAFGRCNKINLPFQHLLIKKEEY